MTSRFDVYLVRLDPTAGHEIQKPRPCLIISPNEMNAHIGTVIVAPLSSGGRVYPSRVPVRFQERAGQIVLDQIRTVDKGRLLHHLGRIDEVAAQQVLVVLGELFAP